MRSLLCRLAGILLAFQVLLPTGANPAHVQLEERYLNPPSQYGMVPFFWWTGEPLSEERIAWELDQL